MNSPLARTFYYSSVNQLINAGSVCSSGKACESKRESSATFCFFFFNANERGINPTAPVFHSKTQRDLIRRFHIFHLVCVSIRITPSTSVDIDRCNPFHFLVQLRLIFKLSSLHDPTTTPCGHVNLYPPPPYFWIRHVCNASPVKQSHSPSAVRLAKQRQVTRVYPPHRGVRTARISRDPSDNAVKRQT